MREKNNVYSGNCSGTQRLRAWASPHSDYLYDLVQCILTSMNLIFSSIEWGQNSGFFIGSLQGLNELVHGNGLRRV